MADFPDIIDFSKLKDKQEENQEIDVVLDDSDIILYCESCEGFDFNLNGDGTITCSDCGTQIDHYLDIDLDEYEVY